MMCRFALAALVILPVACADPCVDDGVNQEKKDNCPGQVASASDSESATTSATDDASATQTDSQTDSMSASMSATQASMSQTGDDETEDASVTEASADATDTSAEATATEGGPGCMNGMLDGDESDVDCGGSCPPCDDGKICHQSPDCQSMLCSPDEICEGGDSCTEVIEDNGCQLCIKTSCCDAVLECFMDEFCHCWVECIEHNNDFDPCVEACMGTGKPGAITSCANSNCNEVGACGD